ncbi:hypothetical protein [Streptomyces virginiae]|uniref:hypothetical protein n=1 Tax=Streptomyces virginiae TaxID=1961 RepID=UPI003663CCA2
MSEPVALDELLLLADRATNLADALHMLEGADRDIAVTILTVQTEAAEQLFLGLRHFASAAQRLHHNHRTLNETKTALLAVTHHARMASEQLGQAMVAHSRRAGPEDKDPDAQWEHRLLRATAEPMRAVRSLLALIPANCTQAAAAFAATIPYSAAAADEVRARIRPGSLPVLQGAALRSAAAGHLYVYKIGPSTYFGNRGDHVQLTRRTTNALHEKGLIQYDGRFIHHNTWRIRLTPTGRAALLDDFAHPHSRTSAAPPPTATLPRQRGHRP